MKCYVTYKMTYAIEVPEEDLKDLYYDDEEEDSPWKDEYDPDKVSDYFNDMFIDWDKYYDISLESADLLNDTVYF